MADQLTAAPGSGSQTTTQTPQAAGQSLVSGASSSDVQPGTATTLLSQQGLDLNQESLAQVSLTSPTTTSRLVTEPAPQPEHHLNAVLLIFPLSLALIAVILFWLANRSIKNTTLK